MPQEPLDTNEMIESATDFEAAYEAYSKPIYRFLYWRTKDTALSEDLTSSVFEKAWRSQTSYKGGSVKAWLYRIARNVLIDHWRSKKELPSEDIEALPETAAITDSSQALDLADQIQRLRQAVDKLPKDMRAVVKLRFIEGLSCKQVAKKLELSDSNVRVIQYRALQKLRGYLR